MADPHPVVTYSKKGAKFDEVREELKLAAPRCRARPWKPTRRTRRWRADGSAASRAALKEVEALLDGIARQALGA